MSNLLSEFRLLITNWITTYKRACVCQITHHKPICYHAPEDINMFRFRLIGDLLEQFDQQHPELRLETWYQQSILIFRTPDPNGPRNCIQVMQTILNKLPP